MGRSIRYAEILSRGTSLVQNGNFSDSTIKNIFLANPELAHSDIIKHKKDRFATEYWIFHKSLYDSLPENEKMDYHKGYSYLRKKDSPCWALTDNGYVVWIKVITENIKKSGFLVGVTPRGSFIKGSFMSNIKENFKPYFIATVDDNAEKYLPKRMRKHRWINGEIKDDPRIYNLIDIYLRTNDPAFSYAVAFHDSKISIDGQMQVKAEKFLRRKDIVELMSDTIKDKFKKALEMLGYKDTTVEEYIVNKRLELIERALNSDKDRHLPLVDKALSGLENLAGIIDKKTVVTEEYTQVLLTKEDRAGLLQKPMEEAEVINAE